jgi:DNA-binding IclR family transcriptional regulator
MNAVAVEQVTADEFIFGDHQLHARFFTAIELLAQIVIATPRPVSAAVLAEALGQPLRVVRALLQSLGRSELVRPDAKTQDAW